MSASSQKETCAFAFETSLLVGQAQQTLVSKRHASWLAIIAVLTAIAGYLQHELQEHPGVAREYGYFTTIGVVLIACATLYWRFRRVG
jgi:magnesium transporter